MVVMAAALAEEVQAAADLVDSVVVQVVAVVLVVVGKERVKYE